jgi:hypothetical protein
MLLLMLAHSKMHEYFASRADFWGDSILFYFYSFLLKHGLIRDCLFSGLMNMLARSFLDRVVSAAPIH